MIRGASHFLSESLGDVQVYSNRDENSQHFVAREAVLAEADATFGVVARRKYKKVVVIGHSLGSVIAFTAIERLSHREPNGLDRVVALITFGTALEKVKFFFERKKDAKRTPIGPQGPRALAQTVASERAWVNLWYWNDPVANPITTFQAQGTSAVNYSGRSPLPAQHVLDEGRQVDRLGVVSTRVERLEVGIRRRDDSHVLRSVELSRNVILVAMPPHGNHSPPKLSGRR